MRTNRIGGITLLIIGLLLSLPCVFYFSNRDQKIIEETARLEVAFKDAGLDRQQLVSSFADGGEQISNILMTALLVFAAIIIIAGISLFFSKHVPILLEKNNLVKKVSTGYSYKSLIFGWFYPIARGDYKGMWIQLLLCTVTIGLSWLITPFVYNKKYITRLIEKGYFPHDEKSTQYLIKNFRYVSKSV